MTTGVPIYLVSACTSGEEFVAAFRRYADKNGLFIPIAAPIQAGRKGRFAVTLTNGGVMIEGDAEVINSATTPSVLHGRVGMTLRFADLDIKSKTVLVELEQARLAMRPQPPSVPPRPANVPAEPRPKVPTPAGRVDANNALAECVAIGDVDALEVHAAAQLAKPGARFVVPSIPPVGPGQRPKTPSAPPVPYIAKPTKQGIEPPPRATPPAGVPPAIPPAPTSTTSPGLAVVRPAVAPAVTRPAVTPMSITTVDAPITPTPEGMTAVAAPITPPPVTPVGMRSTPAPSVTPMSITTVDAPLSLTPNSMPAVDPPLVTPTSMGVVLPPKTPAASEDEPVAEPPAIARTMSDEITQFPQVRAAEVFQVITPAVDDAVPEPVPMTGSKPNGTGRTNLPPPRRTTGNTQPPRMQTPATPLPVVGKVSKPTQIGLPIVQVKAPAPPSGQVPLPPVVAEEKLVSVPEIADEPTDIGVPPVIVDEPALIASGPPEDVAPPVPGGLRKTVIGVAVVPEGVTVLPAAAPAPKAAEDAHDTALMDAQTPIERASVEQPAIEAPAETAIPGNAHPTVIPPVIEEPSGDWTMIPGAEGPTIIPRQPETTPEKPEEPPRLPTGDWTIARDEGSPDGWSEPSKPAAKALHSNARHNTPVAVVSGEKPLESTMSAKAFDIEEETKSGLKIEVDATLVAGEMDPRIVAEAGLASTEHAAPQAPLTPPPGTLQPVAMPIPQTPMRPVPQAMPMPPQPMPMPPQPMPVPMAPPSFSDYAHASRQSGPANLFGGVNVVGDSTSLIRTNRKKRMIVILASAGLAVVIGVVLFIVLRDGGDKKGGTATTKHEIAPPVTPDAGTMALVSDAAAEEPAAPDAADSASVKPAVPKPDCVIEVDSSPSGAEIVRGGEVIGTTPTQVVLPCGVETKLVFRKSRLSSVSKSVTAKDGGRVRVSFAKPMVSVKVTSSPPGATITVGGKSLGVTPAMVKLPANESATLVISKPGFSNDTHRLTPKQNNQSIHVSLKKKGR